MAAHSDLELRGPDGWHHAADEAYGTGGMIVATIT